MSLDKPWVVSGSHWTGLGGVGSAPTLPSSVQWAESPPRNTNHLEPSRAVPNGLERRVSFVNT